MPDLKAVINFIKGTKRNKNGSQKERKNNK
jgi:hypothetical protein